MKSQNKKKELNIQTQNIIQKILFFQIQLRGFLIKNKLRKHVWRLNFEKKHDIENIYRFFDAVFYEKRNIKIDRINDYNIEKNVHDIFKNNVYRFILFQKNSFEKIKNINLQIQRSKSIDNLIHHREFANNIFEKQNFW